MQGTQSNQCLATFALLSTLLSFSLTVFVKLTSTAVTRSRKDTHAKERSDGTIFLFCSLSYLSNFDSSLQKKKP